MLGKGDFPQTRGQMEWCTSLINTRHGLGLRIYIKSLWPYFEHVEIKRGRQQKNKVLAGFMDRHTPLRVKYAKNFVQMQGLQYLTVEKIGVGALTSEGTLLTGKC